MFIIGFLSGVAITLFIEGIKYSQIIKKVKKEIKDYERDRI